MGIISDFDDIARYMANEIQVEIDSEIIQALKQMNFTQAQQLAKKVLDAQEQFTSESLVSYAKYFSELQYNQLEYNIDDCYNTACGIISDWSELIYELSDADKFTLTMIQEK